jgi:hypothetical protein
LQLEELLGDEEGEGKLSKRISRPI